MSCGAELRPGAKFCDECGASQVGVVPAAQPPTHVTERKVTSVLFGDLVGFTALSEQRDKEDVRELLSDYFAQCRRIVTRYGGTIEKFIGDAVMAVWGVPTAHDDDAERAVRAGLELVRSVESLGEQLGLTDLAMRVGVITGEVAVTVGAEHEGMVAGDAVNTAARVQSVAEPGSVWVDETTRLLTSGAITYRDVGSHHLKGKAEPVPLWAVRAVVASVGGQQRADGLEAPLTGRARELRLIKELFHGVEETRRPALVLVNGDPGLGKSRLGWEFEKYIDGLYGVVAWHSTRCLSYGDGVAFWPIAEAVRGRLGLVESDQDADPVGALDAFLANQVHDETEAAWLRPRVLALLGHVASGGFDRDDLFAAWRTFLERAGGDNPVALVIDDAQHADDGTVRFVEHVLANADAPLFVMLLSRPGLLQRWPDLATNRRATVLHLATLEDREMAGLLDGLVNGLPEQVRDGLAERAQGVPLYAIETVRSLIDRDLVVPRGGVYVLSDPARIDIATVGAPASLQAVVAARLDGLPLAERRVIAEASVLGATFTRDAIAALAADIDDLDDVLQSLTRAEILGTVSSRLSAEYGQYRFVQDVVRQVAYNTQSRRDRKVRHIAVAAYLSGLPDPGGEYAPVMAQHYLDAIECSTASDEDLEDVRARAVAQFTRAAQRARSLGAPADAQRYLESALEHAPDEQTTASLHADAAWAAFELGDADSAETHARAAIESYTASGDAIRAAGAAAVLAMTTGFLRADNAGSLKIAVPHWESLRNTPGAETVLLQLARAIGAARVNLNDYPIDIVLARAEIADSIGDRAAVGHALGALSTLLMPKSPTLGEILSRAQLDIGRREQLPRVTGYAIANLSNVLAPSDLTESADLLDEALEAERRSGGEAYNFTVFIMNQVTRSIPLGRLDRADELMTDAPETSNTLVLRPWLDAYLSEVTGKPRRFHTVPDELQTTDDAALRSYAAVTDMYNARVRGDLHAAAQFAVDAVERLFMNVGFSDDMVFIWPLAVETALSAGDDSALATLLAVVDNAQPGLVGVGFRAHRARFAGLIAMRDGNTTDVEPELRTAISAFEDWGSPAYAAKARGELGNWLVAEGRADEGEPLRRTAVDALEAAGARGWLVELGLADARSDVPTR